MAVEPDKYITPSMTIGAASSVQNLADALVAADDIGGKPSVGQLCSSLTHFLQPCAYVRTWVESGH